MPARKNTFLDKLNHAQVREGTVKVTNLLIRAQHKQLWKEEAGVEFFLT